MKKDLVLTISMILAAGSALFIRPDLRYMEYIDWRTLLILFSLMAVMAGFQKLGIFSVLAESLLKRSRSMMQVTFVLVFLCFFCSMLVTNDVALITFVPFTISVYHSLQRAGIFFPEDECGARRKDSADKKRSMDRGNRFLMITVIMQTLAANLGSMLTPPGNPQNLYLCGLGQIGVLEMIRLMLPYSAASAVMLAVWILIENRGSAEIASFGSFSAGLAKEGFDKKERLRCALYSILFFMTLLAVGNRFSFTAAALVVFAAVLLFDRPVFRLVDYRLLLTFTAFFIFTGNLRRIGIIRSFLEQVIADHGMLTAAAVSQIISNVPAALMLSGFTSDIRSLIIGTDLGGLGTLIASMASLISYKYYVQEKPAMQGCYLAVFTAANVLFLAVLMIIYFSRIV